MRINATVLVLALATASSHAAAPARPTAAAHACRPVVRDAWVRMTPTMPMGAGYFTLLNACPTPVVLVGARSERFGEVSMHETRIENGISRMRPLPTVRVAPGERVQFAPGGRHLMLMSPRGGVATDAPIRLQLELADGRRIDVSAAVRDAASP